MTADLVLKNGWVVTPEETVRGGVAISNGKCVAIGTDESLPAGKAVIDLAGKHILPGLIDAHVHFRDPGGTTRENLAPGQRRRSAAESPPSSTCRTRSRRPRMRNRWGSRSGSAKRSRCVILLSWAWCTRPMLTISCRWRRPVL